MVFSPYCAVLTPQCLLVSQDEMEIYVYLFFTKRLPRFQGISNYFV